MINKTQKPGLGSVITLLPGFFSVVGLRVGGFAGNGAKLPPIAALLAVELSLPLFGELLVGGEFFHSGVPPLGVGMCWPGADRAIGIVQAPDARAIIA